MCTGNVTNGEFVQFIRSSLSSYQTAMDIPLSTHRLTPLPVQRARECIILTSGNSLSLFVSAIIVTDITRSRSSRQLLFGKITSSLIMSFRSRGAYEWLAVQPAAIIATFVAAGRQPSVGCNLFSESQVPTTTGRLQVSRWRRRIRALSGGILPRREIP